MRLALSAAACSRLSCTAGGSSAIAAATGAGLAACLAGAVLGFNVSLRSLDDLRAQTVLEQAQMVEVVIDDMENG